MPNGAVTISVDVELAWGNWDNITAAQLALVEEHERAIVARLIEILDRHQIPATFAIVAALLDRDSAAGRPGREDSWYAPDIVEMITSASVKHDIGSHGGRHIYLDQVCDAEADDDIAFARSTHVANGLAFGSFVFPRNRIGKKQVLERHGVKVFRGEDEAWHQRIRNRQQLAGRAANLVDKMLPIAPEAVQPVRDGGMVNVPGSMLFMSRNGLRRFAAANVTATKLRRGVAAAAAGGGVFHLWFHPSNFYHAREAQLALFATFIQELAEQSASGAIGVKPMASFAVH